MGDGHRAAWTEINLLIENVAQEGAAWEDLAPQFRRTPIAL